MRYLIMLRRTSTGYSVDAPDVPGCIATGSSIDHAKQMMTEALEMHFDLLRDSGDSIPPPSHKIEFTIDDTSGEELCTWVDVDMHEPIPS